MTAQRLDGRALAARLTEELAQEVARLKEETGRIPHLVNVMIGQEPDSCAYANAQKRVAEKMGIHYELVTLPGDCPQTKIEDKIRQWNADTNVHGVMLHKPLPSHLDERALANCLDVRKDLEGINVINIGKMLLGETRMIPCTPAAVMALIAHTGTSLEGKEAVVVGASDIVGKPLSLLLLREMATVTVCHIATSQAGRLEDHVRRAEILVVAVGKPNLIPGDWVRPGAIVVDVGINVVEGKIVGDVAFEAAQERAGWITPVPGGVGPVTVVMLMRNGLEAFRSLVGASGKDVKE